MEIYRSPTGDLGWLKWSAMRPFHRLSGPPSNRPLVRSIESMMKRLVFLAIVLFVAVPCYVVQGKEQLVADIEGRKVLSL